MRLTLEAYQQLEAISKDETLDDLDKSLFSICALYGLTEAQLDNYNPKRVLKMADKVNKLFSKPLKLDGPERIHTYKINYSIERITFGQYMELVYFTKHDIVNKAHYIVATMAAAAKDKEHFEKANCFIKLEADTVLGAAIKIKNAFDIFNTTKFKALFEPYPEMSMDSSAMSQWFMNNYGWFFSAKSVAEFEGITLEQAYSLPVVRALNDLIFIKAKGRYDYYLATKKN